MFGYAKKEAGFDTEYMPLAIYLSNRILHNLAQARHSGEISGIEPDAKSQVTLEYDGSIPVGVRKIVVSTQHSADLSQSEVREIVKKYIQKSLPEGWMPSDENILINPTGRFVIGGPDGDTGLTGRKSCRQLRRLCTARRRRLLRQRSDQSRPIGSLYAALSG